MLGAQLYLARAIVLAVSGLGLIGGKGMKSTGLTANQLSFAHYLADLWGKQEKPVGLGGCIPEAGVAGILHCYRVTRSRYWKPWRARVASPVQHWWCRSLGEAALHYSWSDTLPPNSFLCIAGRLRQALAASDEGAARQACLDIFTWGGVAQKPTDKSRVWLEFQYGRRTLCQSIKQAVHLLQPDSALSLTAFDGKELLMNAAMTKVYAAADPSSIIIYDGRVGAALGLLVRYWLEMSGIGSVPSDLAFRWGVGRSEVKRDPSCRNYRFSSLYLPSTKSAHQDEVWASLVRKAGGILKQMKALSGDIASIGDVEKALFMIGFNVECDVPPSPLPAVMG